jgi:hypothetical protein
MAEMTAEERAAAEAQQARGEQVEAAMRAAGQADSTPVQEDYFAFDLTERVDLPDGVSYVDIKVLNEGARRKYLNSVNREVKLQKATGDAVMQLATGDERKAILESSICGWNLMRAGQPVPFSAGTVREFLDRANPKLIDLIEKEVRRINPWLNAEITVEEIDKQIEELNELRDQKLKEQEGNGI